MYVLKLVVETQYNLSLHRNRSDINNTAVWLTDTMQTQLHVVRVYLLLDQYENVIKIK